MSRLKIATNIQLEARENASEQIVIELSFAFDLAEKLDETSRYSALK